MKSARAEVVEEIALWCEQVPKLRTIEILTSVNDDPEMGNVSVPLADAIRRLFGWAAMN